MPHSVYKPDGSIVDGWTKTDSADLGRLTFKNSLIACPTTANKPYQVFAQLPGLTFKPECLGFNVLTCMSILVLRMNLPANRISSRNRKGGCMGILEADCAFGTLKRMYELFHIFNSKSGE